MILILTCEHGGNEIPENYKYLFQNATEILQSHRAYDPGALDVFNYLKDLAGFSKSSTTSRLLIELNRSLHHHKLFSEFTKPLKEDEKQNLIASYYLPYRHLIESEISKHINKNELVLHLSIHSFTPRLNLMERRCDVGLLYDSQRHLEKQFAEHLKTAIKNEHPKLNVRFNYPYLGKADGLTTYLRQIYLEKYLGIEIEINQKFSNSNVMDTTVKHILRLAIESTLKIKA